jgi:hypothetical protein
MQDSSPIPHSLTQLLWYALAIITASVFGGGTIAAVIGFFLNRSKQKAEIHQTDAGAFKALAEARSIDTQTSINAGEAVLRMVQQLAFAEVRNQEQDAEIERLNNENEAYEKQIRWAKATFKVRGIPWDETPP